jgi:hypothetical protein
MLNQQQLYKQCKPLVSNQWWGSLEELLNHWVDLEVGALCRSTDLGQVREAQGKIKAIRQVLALPEEIKRMDRQVTSDR